MELLRQIAQALRAGQRPEEISTAFGVSLAWLETVMSANAFALVR
jgi:uncharacterized protein (DUF433 family)